MCSLKTCEEFVNVFRKNGEEQKSFVFCVDGFENLTAQEVIDNLEQHFKNDCHDIIDGVRLTSRHCFVSVKDVESFKKLNEAGLSIREKSIQPEDVWERSTILQLSAVPHPVLDEQIVAIISRFADVIGNVERQTYKGFDTGERFVHIITPDIIPCQLLLGSICLPVTVIYPIQKHASIARRKSFRSQININLKTPDLEADENTANESSQSALPDSCGAKQEPSFFSKSTGIDVDTNVFQFPSPSTSTIPVCTPSSSKKKQNTLPANCNKDAKNASVCDSPSVFRKLAQRSVNSFRRHNCENSQPPSPAMFPNTPRILRRSSVNFRNGSGEAYVRSRGMDLCSGEFGSGYMRERSASDASSRQSICRRKLSVTGHENSTKIPWCGCWGIGCC